MHWSTGISGWCPSYRPPRPGRPSKQKAKGEDFFHGVSIFSMGFLMGLYVFSGFLYSFHVASEFSMGFLVPRWGCCPRKKTGYGDGVAV